jgi:pimeloyl-ACP methyl ester carboxylesterase
LLLALRRPDLVGRLVAIGANYHWNVVPDLTGAAAADAEAPAGEDADPMDQPVVSVMAAAYGERSPDGAEHFPVVAAKGFHLFGIEPELTADDLARVSVPVLLMAGDDDIIPLSHTAAFFAALPEAQLAIVPGASHGLPMEHPLEVVGLIERFLGSDVPPRTMMPNARA